ncbi:MAG: hemolysin III family protein [Paracoccaceae bacterium]
MTMNDLEARVVPLGKSYSRAEAWADMTVHALGVVGALLAVPVLITLAAVWRDDWTLVAAVTVYGMALIVMFSASAGYNFASLRMPGGRLLEALRRIDHAAIYVKIAGTYTPYAVITGGPMGRWLLVGVWSTAIVGLLGKIIAPDRWQKLSLLLYLALGWCIVLVFGPVSAAITNATAVLIVIGGLLYSVGVIFHVWERLPFQNAIWHGFVLVATFVFYSAMMVEIATGS